MNNVQQIVAASLVSLLDESDMEFAATGFADVTRPALKNVPNIDTEETIESLDNLLLILNEYKIALTNKDKEKITSLLNSAQSHAQATTKENMEKSDV